MPYTKEEHRIASAKIQRDSKGHFVHTEKNVAPDAVGIRNPVEKFIKDHTSYHKTQDDLLDIHVGNPLHKIVVLLEDIKKQKAFSFTLKGSLGIAGVALALGVFGIFGGGKILCDRGVQSQIGTVKVLNIYDNNTTMLPFNNILNLLSPKAPHKRIVLVKTDETVISLQYSSKVDLNKFSNYPVIATGNYNACSQTLTVSDPKGIEIFPR